ncbi:MAG: thioredoxin [Bacteroidetes bacterium]|nr:MAG: thioredoxin [Bacteroidota bacterium]PTM12265.1 MAG: thioredoxin [Bacteroidota bacterium]
MQRSIYLTLGLLLFLSSSCQPAPTPASDSPAQETTPPLVQNVLHLPVTDTLPYPIVEEFANLAPIFNFRNDTTYVINFWATWCGPCVAELPYFERLAAATANQPVKIVLVSLDFRRDVRTKLLRFIRERPLELPVIALTDNKTNIWIDQVDPTWGGAIPITIIYRNDQRQFFSDQFADYEELASAVQSLQ